jgi:putative hemolysin
MEIFVISFLILLNGVFAMYEIALVSSRKSRLQEKARSGNIGAKMALKLLAEPEKILSAIQVGITLVGIISGAYGGLAFTEDVEPLFAGSALLAPYAKTLAMILVVGLITYFSLIVGELVPKTIALNNPEAIAVFLSPAMNFVGKITYPVVWFLSISTKLVIKLFRIKDKKEVPITEEELRILLKQGSEHGVIEKEESDIINEVIRFGGKRAGTIMTHRLDVKWIDSTDSVADIIEMAKNESHSRLLVCNEIIENIKGVVTVRDLFSSYIDTNTIDFEKIMHEPLYIPEQLPAIKVLELFRETRKHFGIVVNEYGSMEGIITLHDVAENIMGDFPAIEDSYNQEVFRRDDGSYLIDGSMMLEDVQDLFELNSLFELGDAGGNINTLGGFAMYKLNRIPKVGDKFYVKDFVFEIMDMDGLKVDKILVKKE